MYFTDSRNYALDFSICCQQTQSRMCARLLPNILELIMHCILTSLPSLVSFFLSSSFLFHSFFILFVCIYISQTKTFLEENHCISKSITTIWYDPSFVMALTKRIIHTYIHQMLKVAVLNSEIIRNLYILLIFFYIFYDEKDITFIILKVSLKLV